MFVTIMFVMKREPVSRRDRPAKAPLSRAAIVGVAMRVMQEEGLGKVTMRRIAAELDTGPASLYVYVANAAELHGAIFDELLAGLPAPQRVTGSSWRSAVIGVMAGYTHILFAQPSLARSVLTLRPSGPRYLALVDWLLQAMRVGGVPVKSAAWGVDLLLQTATAAAAEHGTREESPEAAGEEARQVAAVLGLDEDAYPGLAWAGELIFSGTGTGRLRWAFDRILAGIAGGGQR